MGDRARSRFRDLPARELGAVCECLGARPVCVSSHRREAVGAAVRARARTLGCGPGRTAELAQRPSSTRRRGAELDKNTRDGRACECPPRTRE